MVERTGDHTQTVVWTWSNVYDAVYKVARDIRIEERSRIEGMRGDFKFKELVAVSRGGLIPATLLSHLLSLPITGIFISPQRLELFNHMRRIEYRDQGKGEWNDIIVVDDICDTGSTFKEVRRRLPLACRVCLCAKEAGRGHCEAASLEYKDYQWLSFPWELSPLS